MLYHLMVQVHNSLHPGQILWGGIGNGCQPGLTVPLHPIPDPQTGHKPDKMIPDALLQKKDITVRGRNCWGLGAGGGSLVGGGICFPHILPAQEGLFCPSSALPLHTFFPSPHPLLFSGDFYFMIFPSSLPPQELSISFSFQRVLISHQ